MTPEHFSPKITSGKLNENLYKTYGVKINFNDYDRSTLEDIRNKIRTQISQLESKSLFNDLLENDEYQKGKMILGIINQKLKEMVGESRKIVKEKAVSKKQQQAAGIALKAKREGKKPKGKGAAAEMAKMPKKELEKFAGTPHKGLPEKKKKKVRESYVPSTPMSRQELRDKISRQQEKLKAQNNVRGTYDLSNLNLNGLDLTGIFTTNIVGRHQLNLSGTHFIDSNLTGTYLVGANLSNANLKNANLTKANLKSATLNGAILSGANVDETIFSAADLSGIERKNMKNADKAINAAINLSEDKKTDEIDREIRKARQNLTARGRTVAKQLSDYKAGQPSEKPKKPPTSEGKKPKPDFLDLDGDGNKTEPMKSAAKEKKSRKTNMKPTQKNSNLSTKRRSKKAVNESYRRHAMKVNESVSRLLNEDEEGKAKDITAAADMVNDFTGWMQRVGQYQTKSMIELADSIRSNFGQAEAETFKTSVQPALESALAALTQSREQITKAVAVLAGEEDASTMMGQEPNENNIDSLEEPDLDIEPASSEDSDKFSTSDAAAGGAEVSGRELRESQLIKKARQIAESNNLIRKLAGK